MEQYSTKKRDRSSAEIDLKYKQNKRILNEGFKSLNLNQYTAITDVVEEDAPTSTSTTNSKSARDVSSVRPLSTIRQVPQSPRQVPSTSSELQLPTEEEQFISVLKDGKLKYLRKVDYLVDELIRKTHRKEFMSSSRSYCPQEFDSKIPPSTGPSPTVDHALSMPLWPIKIFDSTHFLDGAANIDVHPHKVTTTRSRGGSNAIYVSGTSSGTDIYCSSSSDSDEYDDDEEGNNINIMGCSNRRHSSRGGCRRRKSKDSNNNINNSDEDEDVEDVVMCADDNGDPVIPSGYLGDGERGTGIRVRGSNGDGHSRTAAETIGREQQVAHAPCSHAGDTTHTDWGIEDLRTTTAGTEDSRPATAISSDRKKSQQQKHRHNMSSGNRSRSSPIAGDEDLHANIDNSGAAGGFTLSAAAMAQHNATSSPGFNNSYRKTLKQGDENDHNHPGYSSGNININISSGGSKTNVDKSQFMDSDDSEDDALVSVRNNGSRNNDQDNAYLFDNDSTVRGSDCGDDDDDDGDQRNGHGLLNMNDEDDDNMSSVSGMSGGGRNSGRSGGGTTRRVPYYVDPDNKIHFVLDQYNNHTYNSSSSGNNGFNNSSSSGSMYTYNNAMPGASSSVQQPVTVVGGAGRGSSGMYNHNSGGVGMISNSNTISSNTISSGMNKSVYVPPLSANLLGPLAYSL